MCALEYVAHVWAAIGLGSSSSENARIVPTEVPFVFVALSLVLRVVILSCLDVQSRVCGIIATGGTYYSL
jgi:hypothetical protein